jgi:hypothetical protein
MSSFPFLPYLERWFAARRRRQPQVPVQLTVRPPTALEIMQWPSRRDAWFYHPYESRRDRLQQGRGIRHPGIDSEVERASTR